MKRLLILAASILGLSPMATIQEAGAQNWYSKTDRIQANYCYRERGGIWMDAVTGSSLSPNTMANDVVLAYYWRIPKGQVRADMVWTNSYLRSPQMRVVVTYPATGDTLATNTVTSTGIRSEERTSDLFGTISFPEDDFYRVQISCDHWNWVRNIKYFTFQHESSDSVMIPRNYGGTSPHMNTAGSTDPDAPNTYAYDWGYVECMTPAQYSYTATFYMPMSAGRSYMGMQNSGANGNDVNRNILFSVWDNGNMDANPHLPLYMQSRVMDGNENAVHTHAGGEGSSASVMFKDSPNWWRPGHWTQFLMNVRPEVVKIPSTGTLNPDSTFDYNNLIMSTWYKVDTMPEWRYLATIRASGQSSLLVSWGAFMEPFTSYHGQMLHRMFMRNAMVRSASSGRWYNINRYSFYVPSYGRDFHYDVGRGASSEFPGTFFMDMGQYIHIHDSARVVPLVTDKSCVDTINTDRLLRRVEEAIMRDSRLDKNWLVNETADFLPGSTWTVDNQQTSGGGVNGTPANMVDDNDNTIWSSTAGFPNNVVLSARADQTISSMYLFWENKYSWRARLLDVYTSEDGTDWQLAFDSLEIRCEDTTQVSFPHPITASHFKFVFYKGWDSSNLSINTLKLRGAYNLDRLKALAKKQIDNQNQYTYFSSEALQPVIQAYDNGNTTDAPALAAALREMFNNNVPLNYGRARNAYQLTKGRAYTIRNNSGHGYLKAGAEGSLTATGATISGAKEEYTAAADMHDPYTNWLVVRSEQYNNVYLYNIGARKYLNTTADGYLSDEPEPLTMTGASNSFTFRGQQGYIGINATENGALTSSSSYLPNIFSLYDSYTMRQPDSLASTLLAKLDEGNKLSTYKSGARSMLNAPIGVVGGFTSQQAKDAVQAAYDNADQDTEAFYQAVDNADIIAFDPDHAVYNITSASQSLSDTPYFTVTSANRLEAQASNTDGTQIWRFQKKNDGYTMHAHGQVIKPIIANNTGTVIQTTSSQNGGGTLVLDEISWGNYAIGPAQNCNYMINGASSPMITEARTISGSVWQLTPATTYSVSLNSVGVSGGYYDFAIRLPEGLHAYTANYVTQDGVIKLTEINDVVPAQTPVLLRGDARGQYDLEVLNTPAPLDSANIFGGTFERNTSMLKGSFYTLTSSNGRPVMRKPPLAIISANSIYLPVEEYMPALDTYTFDFDNLVDAVSTATVDNASGDDAGAPAYTIDGRRAYTTQKGNIYIRNHKKVLE